MPTIYHYRCTVEWTGATSGPTRDTRSYSRDALVTFPKGSPIAVSAAPEFQGAADRTDPEELFVASLATCQMLTYLYLAARNGVKVLEYSDEADGEMRVHDGKLRIVLVMLCPTITITADSDAEHAYGLVEHAHLDCFIANSVACAVRTTPTIRKAQPTESNR
jgi:organic hydroperoxide reductase OsmC/OhrA